MKGNNSTVCRLLFHASKYFNFVKYNINTHGYRSYVKTKIVIRATKRRKAVI